MMNKLLTIFSREYEGGEGEIIVENEVIGRVEGITVNVNLNIEPQYEEGSIPSDFKGLIDITGKISKVTIYMATSERLLGIERAIDIEQCLHGRKIEDWTSMLECDISTKSLKDSESKNGFEATIKGVRLVMLLPSVSIEEKSSKCEYAKNYIVKDVNFIAKDIERR